MLKDFPSFFTAKTIKPNLVCGSCFFALNEVHLGSLCIPMGLKVSVSFFKSLKPPFSKKGKIGTPWATIWTHNSSFCSLLKIKQLCQISLYLTKKSAL